MGLLLFTIVAMLGTVSGQAVAAGEPPNDSIASSIDLGATPGATVSNSATRTGNTNASATLETNESDSFSSWTKSVWFKAKLAAGRWEFGVTDANWDTMMVIGTLANPAAATPFHVSNYTIIASNDDFGNTTLSRTSFVADGTTTYYIGVAGYDNSQGSFSLEFNKLSVIANDNIAQATTVTPPSFGNPTTVAAQHTYGATIETASSESQRLQDDMWGNSVWFKMVPAETKDFKFVVNSGQSARFIVIKKSFADNTFVYATDVTRPPLSSASSVVRLDSGVTYFIGVSSLYETTFSLVVSQVVLPTVVTNIQVNQGTTTNISWAAPSPPAGVTWTMNYGVFLEHAASGLTRDTGATTTSASFSRLLPGTWTYDISAFDTVQGVSGANASGTFTVTSASNDMFSAARVLGTDSGSLNDFFGYATREANEPPHSSSQLNSSLWYALTPSANATHSFTVSASAVTAYVSVYTGSGLETLTRMQTGVDSTTWVGTAGTRYYVAVTTANDFANSGGGDFTLSWASVPSVSATSPTTTVAPAAVVAVRTVKGGNNATPLTLAKKAKIAVPKSAKVTLSVKTDSKKICALVNGRLRFKKKSACKITIKVAPKTGKASAHAVIVTS